MIKMEKDIVEIRPIENLDSCINAPPSKAHTLRALFISALAEGNSIIHNALIAEDQKYAIDVLKKLGLDIDIKDNSIFVKGCSGKFSVKDPNLFVGNSGVTARVLVSLCALSDKDITIDGTDRMRSGRPITDLIEALSNLGVEIKSVNGDGCLPLVVSGNSFEGGVTSLKGDKSSQYFTSILLSAPYASKDVLLKTEGELKSKPYVDITINMMKEFGVEVLNKDYKEFFIKSGQKYKAREYTVEGDFSNASFFFAAAAVTQGKIRVSGLNLNSCQGDKQFVDFL